MNTGQTKRALTLGDLIESGYRACGKCRAAGFIRLAAEAGFINCVGLADPLRNAIEVSWK